VKGDVMSKKKLAEKIATKIMTVYGPGTEIHECTRAQLMLMQPNRTEKNMGGRNKRSIISVLLEYLPDQPEPITGEELLDMGFDTDTDIKKVIKRINAHFLGGEK